MHIAQPRMRPFRSAVTGLAPYVAGLSTEHVRKRNGLTDVVKLASNENPLGASASTLNAIAEALGDVSRYPDPYCSSLRRAIADSTGIPPDHLAFGNGSEDLIGVACRAFLDPGDAVVLSSPTFPVYASSSKVMGAEVIDVPLRRDLSLDADAVCRAITPRTKLVFLCNPNNPSGTWIGRSDFDRVCRAAGTNTVIVVDEAYYEYARAVADYPDSLAVLPSIEAKWLVLRTFSKAYGLAGLRIGYAIASEPAIARQLEIVRTAFNVSHLAQVAARAAWSDQTHLARSVAHNLAERRRLEREFRRRGFEPAKSAANFLFVNTRRGNQEVAERLLDHGVIVKPWSGDFSSYIRVSIGTSEQNDRFLAAFDRIVQPEP